ncbi:ABC1 kinase family protein [Candidatus Nucleicultrix amoebiphila]|jgi:predicted unusual protein kinase regulating ubiquinone biosynthesis (AarF/ABC1/UbiB family)|uniref:ABC transporter ATP-binding protein n=1 Tax=Candidatus Nucleicultrix amoebiphila FS5 TaxID=1414854 RepID=A0A1W6N300_9PROT|nr:AarF/ABC1/UbiB kinase family protein [Candidatus Nucleicultrix amoebiphila]ARN84254.1 ABC transporter ATP-binding protein [Candidatus Nucleicultrix amoebiphila FS5]
MTLEEDNLGQRLKRYANVSSALSGSAIRFFSERFLGISLDHNKEAFALTAALGNLRGPIMKIAQMLATIPNAVPPEYADEFLQLQSDAPSMGWHFVKRRMQAELGLEWQSKFQSFDQEASAAASLGQVHRAVTKEGQSVACKLQYPDMTSTVEADLKQLKIILSLYKATIGALDTNELMDEISDRLREELNYALEAKHIALYNEILSDIPQVHVPQVFPDLSTRRLLTMSWMDGKRLMDVIDSPQSYRDTLSQNLFKIWYTPFYHYGVIHGDPHLGNYTFHENGDINLLDYGCVRRFSGKFVEGVLMLYRAILLKDDNMAAEAYKIWGFQDLSKELREVLNLWAHMLYDPLIDDRIRPIQHDTTGVYGRETAGKIHGELRRLGGIKPPREFVFMDRAAVGVGSVFMRLNAQLNWHKLFEEIIENFESDALEKRQEAILDKVGLTPE